MHRLFTTTFLCAIMLTAFDVTYCDIVRWDTLEVIPGTRGISPGPGSQLDHLSLEYARFFNLDLTGSNFSSSNLSNAFFLHSNLTDVNFTNAVITDAAFLSETKFSISKEQLYSTASYTNQNLRGFKIHPQDVSAWNFENQDLTGAVFEGSPLRNTSFHGANITGADFSDTTAVGFTKEQLYSTSSYRSKSLDGLKLQRNDLSGWDFYGQSLVDSWLGGAVVDGTNFSRANLTNVRLTNVRNANFDRANLSGGVLPVTQMQNAIFTNASLRGKTLGGRTGFETADFRGADFRRANVTAPALAEVLQATRNLIWVDGSIRTLDIRSGESLLIRDDAFGVTSHGGLQIAADAEIEFFMSDGDWRSPLSVFGAVAPNVDGNLVLSFESDAVAAANVGRTFDLFDWHVSPDGQFNIVSRYGWDTSRLYSTGEVTLTDATVLTGDANGDRHVNDADLSVWEAYRFLSHTDWRRGDFNGDDRTDVSDFNVWHNHRELTSSASVPEPSMAVSAIIALVLLSMSRLHVCGVTGS